MRALLLYFLLASPVFLAQNILLTWKGEVFELGQCYALSDSSSIQIETFKFYLQSNDSKQKPFVYLIDAQDASSLQLPFGHHNWQIGLDSALQVQDSFQDALDPLHGMYWAWNTGFISLKCVGSVHFNNHSQKLPLELHLGGYRLPNTCVILLPSPIGTLQIDLFQWLNSVVFNSNGLTIMLPSKEAKQLFDLLQNAVYVAP